MYDFIEKDADSTIFRTGTKLKESNILIDKLDQARIENARLKWHVKSIDGQTSVFCYKTLRGKSTLIQLPHFLLSLNSDVKVRFKNNNSMDCRKSNLEIAPEELSITQATFKDVESMLALNYRVYPKEWHVSKDFVLEVLKKNPDVYNLIKSHNDVKGITTFLPLDERIYNKVLEGKIHERELHKYILSYNDPKDVFLYFISMIVDISEPNYKTYSKPLILNIPEQLKSIQDKGMTIKGIGAIAISQEGISISNRMGFEFEHYISENNQQYPVYQTSYQKLIQNIKKE